MLRPIAQTRQRAGLLDGRRHRARPAGRARAAAHIYFRQRFAQVTNPPIDHLRERS